MRRAGFPYVCVLLAGSFVLQNTAPQNKYKLVKLWELPIGSFENVSFSGVAVCPDGTVYVISRHGEVKTIHPKDKLVGQEQVIAQLANPASAACDGRRRLYVADGKLSILEPDAQGKLNPVSSKGLKARVSRLFVTPHGSIYGISFDSSGRRFLDLFTPDGKVSRSFENRYRATGPFGFESPGRSLTCCLTWDASQGRVVYVPPGGPEILFFDEEGNPLGQTPVPPLPLPPDISRGIFEYGLLSLVSLPNGEFAREVAISESEIVRRVSINLEVLDGSLNLISSPLQTGDFGHLLGASNDGVLYFLRSTDGKDLDLVSSSLVRIDSVLQKLN